MCEYCRIRKIFRRMFPSRSRVHYPTPLGLPTDSGAEGVIFCVRGQKSEGTSIVPVSCTDTSVPTFVGRQTLSRTERLVSSLKTTEATQSREEGRNLRLFFGL